MYDCKIKYKLVLNINQRKEAHKMGAEVISGKGALRISNTVIAKLAGYVATQCYGVVAMVNKSGKDGILKMLKLENMDKGIKVKVEDNIVDLTLYIVAEYGVNIVSVSETIKTNVKYHVEKFTGLRINQVKVVVESVRVE